MWTRLIFCLAVGFALDTVGYAQPAAYLYGIYEIDLTWDNSVGLVLPFNKTVPLSPGGSRSIDLVSAAGPHESSLGLASADLAIHANPPTGFLQLGPSRFHG